MDIDLFKYCELFYASHYIPVTVYKGKERITTFSSMEIRLDIFSLAASYSEKSEFNP